MPSPEAPGRRAETRKRAAREMRRQSIVDAARRLLEERGIEDARMDDVAAAADYTRRTLYSYFKSRHDVLLRVHVEDLTRRWQEQRRALVGIEGGPARLTAWAEALHASWKQNPHAMRMEQYWDFHGIEPDEISPELFREFEALNDDLAEGLREIFLGGIEDGSLRSDLPVDVCISQFVYTLRAVLSRALSSTYSFSSINPDEYVRHYLEQYCRGVQP